ncbi:hypothetical protein Psuf_061770 [Phytohabitans suffuscus]|uniref:DUF2637 domain-containing protein n=2 Tax=Phytohabitans suffuscus TaxID=624315 RepID=A0A6F8YRY4_9ACTN|nr:hypothetical protein Psuf_061770 [Phytohabitans suffuscus]
MTAPEAVSASARVDRATRVEGVVQIVIMLAIGGAAGAASFTHVHNLAAAHGQDGWLAWADAIVLELMSIASGLELRRRKRVGKPVWFPAAVLVVAVVLSLAAQVVEAERSVIGWIAAALPAAGFLAMVKIALGRTAATGPAAPEAGDAGWRAGPPSGTAGDGPGRATDDRSQQSTANAAAEADAGEEAYLRGLVPAALAASAELAGQGRPLSREALADTLRRDGHAMSNARASALVRLVKQHTHVAERAPTQPSTTDDEDGDEPGDVEAGEPAGPDEPGSRGPPQ